MTSGGAEIIVGVFGEVAREIIAVFGSVYQIIGPSSYDFENQTLLVDFPYQPSLVLLQNEYFKYQMENITNHKTHIGLTQDFQTEIVSTMCIQRPHFNRN